MRSTRGWILTIGPIVLVAACYAIAAPSRSSSTSPITAADDESVQLSGELSDKCRTVAKSLRRQLPLVWTILIHEPFVLCADMDEDRLEQHYEQTIAPTSQALSISYFTNSPSDPISILLCSTDEQFRECNLRLDAQERNQYSGLYSRKDRRIIVNIASGEGTLAHELTHALAHADFPTMPEWFDEGLASLHEECEFSSDGLHLIGNKNWRHEVAVEALHRGELRLLEDVASKRFGLFERANVDYAHVRSLCLYLQQRGLLEAFYRACQTNAENDPTGLRSLCAVAQSADPKSLDDDFRAWLIGN